MERAAPSGARGGPSLVARLLERGERPDACAAIHFGSDGLQGVSWGAILERVRAVSEALVARGVGPGERVALIAGPRLDACVADLAILGARGVTVLCGCGEDAEVEPALDASGARIAFVGGDVAEGRRLARVEQLVSFDRPSDPAGRIVSMGVLEAQGRALVAGRAGGLEARAAELRAADPAWLHDLHGPRGGTTLTHGRIAARAAAIPLTGAGARDDVVLLSLPLATDLGQLVHAAWLHEGFHLAFPRGTATTLEDAAMVGASVISAHPRLLEELFLLVVAHGDALPGVQGRSFRWAMRRFERYARARLQGGEAALSLRLARRLLVGYCRADLRARLGGRMRGFLSGGAPLSGRVALFFEECGLPLLDAHRLAETGQLDGAAPRDAPVLE